MAGIILFTATRCGYCPAVKAQVEALEPRDDLATTVVVVDENTENMDIARNWHISAVPTLLFVKNAEEIARHQGAISKEQLESYVERCVQ